MKKQTGATLLIAGTCIGSGMIALPMVMAKLGLVPSIILILITWLVSYYTALMSLELHLKAGKGLSIGELAGYFSEPKAEILGVLCLKLLSYALLAVYIYGSASILQNLFKVEAHLSHIATFCAIAFALIFLLPIKLIDGINRISFIGFVIVFAILLTALASMINLNNLPLFSENQSHITTWPFIIPFIFTSFGFQGSLHTITNYCDADPTVLRKAVFWGTLIPAVVYIVWAVSTMSLIFDQDTAFYAKMMKGDMEVGELIKELTLLTKWGSIQLLVWWISLLAIFTSVLGVGAGLSDSIKSMLPNKITLNWQRTAIAVIGTILPSYIISVLVPNAFVVILGFAGMILAIIAIGLPVYLLHKSKITKPHYDELKRKRFIILSGVTCAIIMVCEVVNIIK